MTILIMIRTSSTVFVIALRVVSEEVAALRDVESELCQL